MSKRFHPTSFADFRAKQEQEGSVEITIGDATFTAKLDTLFTDAEFDAWRDLPGSDAVGAARLHLGDQYDAFVEAGGTGPMLMAYLRQVTDEMHNRQGASSGE